MNILVIHEADYINQVIFEYQIIPEILSSKGHRVYVIDFSSKREKKGLSDIFSFKTKYIYNVKKANKKRGITLIRPGMIKIPGFCRLSAFISHFFIIGKVINKHKIDAIILYSVPTNGIQTGFWAKRYNIPVIFRLTDVIHQLVPFPYKLFRLPIHLIEKMIHSMSNEVFAVTPRITKYAIKNGANPKTTTYLPSASDADLFYPKKKNKALLKKYGLSQKDTVILFAGTLYRFSGLDKIISAMPRHLKKLPNLKLVIVGSGEQGTKLQKLIDNLNLKDKVILTGFINYERLANYINLADVCFNSFDINPATNTIFPGKIYQYAACGKPTIATKLQGMTDIFPPKDSKKHGIFYIDTIDEMYQMVPKLVGVNIKDPNPTIQQITDIIEKKLGELN